MLQLMHKSKLIVIYKIDQCTVDVHDNGNVCYTATAKGKTLTFNQNRMPES